jgi:hypothetical protein
MADGGVATSMVHVVAGIGSLKLSHHLYRVPF